MKRQITVTMQVRVELPSNSNAQEIMNAVRGRVQELLQTRYKIVMQAELEDRVTVKLVKKEIQYV